MPDIDLPKLIELLVKRLNPVVPEGTRLEAQGTDIATFGRDGLYGTRGFLFAPERHGKTKDRVAATARDVLSAVQDEIAEATHGTAWPGDGRALPSEWARVEGDVLLSGFGDGILTLEPIPLRYFMPSEGGRIR